MEYVVAAVSIIIILIVVIIRNRKLEKQKILTFLQESFGRPKDENITHNHFIELKKILDDREDALPDSVWNDLNMDSVYEYVDQSVSAIGEEYLYLTMHTLQHDTVKLKKRINLAKELSDKKLSLSLRYKLLSVKKQEYMTIHECIKTLSSAKQSSTLFHVFCLLLFLGSFVFTFFQPEIGFMPCIIIAGFNCVVYLNKKSNIARYDDAVQSIVKWLNMIDDISRENVENKPEFNELINKTEKYSHDFSSFRRFSWLLAPKSAVGSIMDMLMDYVKFVTHLDLIKFNLSVKLLKTRQRELIDLYNLTGELELAIIISGVLEMDRKTCVAQFDEGKKLFINSSGMTHPLLSEPVANDCITENNILLTGSNASGKSTYLKMVGVNVILTQTLGIAFADNYKAALFDIRTSINISDDIISGDSFYLAEIKRIKTLIEAVDKGNPLLICIDEILKGTNTVERIAASAEILRYFAKDNVVVLAATHDIELTGLLAEIYDNYYFTENVNLSNIFDYKLRKGVVYTSNAIKLLERYGYPDDIIRNSYEYINKE
ncbi:MAG: hypothetical protein IJZ25_02035 [Lachnospiraceae bacterium]|nr:hypothetical protein [Lachnospiraceae bacterium]